MDDGGKCLLDVINDPLLFQSFFEGREDADGDGLSANMLDQHLESLANSATSAGGSGLNLGGNGIGVGPTVGIAPSGSATAGGIPAALRPVSLANGGLVCPPQNASQSAGSPDGAVHAVNKGNTATSGQPSSQQLTSTGLGFGRLDDFGLQAPAGAQIPSQINLDQINLRLDSSAPGLEALQQQLLSSPAYQAGLSKAFSDVHTAVSSQGQGLSNGQLSADLEGCLNGTSESPPATTNSSSSSTSHSHTTAPVSSSTTAALAHNNGIGASATSNAPNSSQVNSQLGSGSACGGSMEVASPQAGTAPRAVPHPQPPPPTAYSPAAGPVASPVLQAGGIGGASPAPPPSPAALAQSQRSTPTLSGVASPLMAGCVGAGGSQVQIVMAGTRPGSVPPRTVTPSQSPRLLNGGASTPNGLGGGSNPASNPATPVPSVTSDVATPSPSPHLQQMATQQQQHHVSLAQQTQAAQVQQLMQVAVSSATTTTQTSSITVAPQSAAQPQIILGPQQASILQAGGSGTILLNQAMLQQQLQAAGQMAAAAGATPHHHHHHSQQQQQQQQQPFFVQSVNGQLQLVHRPSTAMLQPTQVAGTVAHAGQSASGPGAKAIMLGHPGQQRPNFVLAPKLNPGGGLSFQLQPASPQQQPLLIQPQQVASTIHLAGAGPAFVQMGPATASAQPQLITAATPPLATTPSPAPASQTPSPAPSNSSKPPTPSGKESNKGGGKNATSSATGQQQQQQNKGRPSVNLGDLLKEHGILDASPPPSPSPQPSQQQEQMLEQVPAHVLEPPKKSALLERLTSAPPPTPPATTQKVGMLQINGNMVPVVLPAQMAGQLQSLQMQHAPAVGSNVITVQSSSFRQASQQQLTAGGQQQSQVQVSGQQVSGGVPGGAAAAATLLHHHHHSHQQQHRGQQQQQQQLQPAGAPAVATIPTSGLQPTAAAAAAAVAAVNAATGSMSATSIAINTSSSSNNNNNISGHSSTNNSSSNNSNNSNNNNNNGNITAMHQQQQQQNTVIQAGANQGQQTRMVYLSGNAALGEGGKVVSLVGGQIQQVGALGSGGQVVIRQGVPPRPPQTSPVNDPLYERLKTQLAGLSALENPTAQQRLLLQQMVALQEKMKQQVQQQQQQQAQLQQQMVTQQHPQQVLVTTPGGGQVVLGGGPVGTVGQPQIITIQPQHLQQLQNAAAANNQQHQRPQQHLRTIAPAPSGVQVAGVAGGSKAQVTMTAAKGAATPGAIEGGQILRLANGQTALLNGAHALSGVGAMPPGVVVVQTPASHQMAPQVAAGQPSSVQVTTVSVAPQTSTSNPSTFVNALNNNNNTVQVVGADSGPKLQQHQQSLLLGSLGGVGGLAGLQANPQLFKKLVLGNVNGIPTVVQLNASQLSQLGQFGQLTSSPGGVIQLLQQQHQQQQNQPNPQQPSTQMAVVQSPASGPQLVMSSAPGQQQQPQAPTASAPSSSLLSSAPHLQQQQQQPPPTSVTPVIKSVSSLLSKMASVGQSKSASAAVANNSGVVPTTSISAAMGSSSSSGQIHVSGSSASTTPFGGLGATGSGSGAHIQVKLQPPGVQAVVKTEACDSTVVTPPSASPLPPAPSHLQGTAAGQMQGGAGGASGVVGSTGQTLVSSASAPACPPAPSPLPNGPPLAAEAPNTSSPPHQPPHHGKMAITSTNHYGQQTSAVSNSSIVTTTTSLPQMTQTTLPTSLSTTPSSAASVVAMSQAAATTPLISSPSTAGMGGALPATVSATAQAPPGAPGGAAPGGMTEFPRAVMASRHTLKVQVPISVSVPHIITNSSSNNNNNNNNSVFTNVAVSPVLAGPTVKTTPPKKKKKKKTKKEREMEQAERDRVAKEKMALTAVKTETGSPPPPTPVAAISALTTTPVIPTVAKVLIKQDVSVSPQANGGFELIPSVAPVVLPTPTTPPVQRPPAPVAPTTAPTTALPAGKTKDVRDSKDKEARADGKEVKESAKDAGKESKDTKDGTKASAKVMTPAMTKAAKKRQAAKERERLAQEKFKRQRFEQRVANDQKEVLTPRLEPFKERQEAIKRLLSYHVADVAEPSVLALQECDAAFERLSARMLQAKEHLISRFQLASLKAGMSETPMNERLLVSQLLLDDEKQLQSERVEETLSLMEGPDPTEFFPMPSSHHNQPTAMETGSDRGGSAAMDPPSGGAGCDEPRPEMLLPDDLDEAEDHEVDEQAEREDDALLDQRGRADADADVDDGIDQASGLMRMDEVHGPDSLDMDEGASCHSVGGTLGDGDGGYPRLASLGVPSVPSVHSSHSQPPLGEDSLSELVTDGQLLSNQLLAQSDDPDLDNAVNSILFA